MADRFHWRLWLGLAVSLASVYLVARQVELDAVAHHVGRSDPRLLAVLVASVPITLWMKAARWRLFFRPSDPVTTSGLFSAIFIGYMVSVIVPLRAGEIVRVFLVAGGSNLRWSRVLATVVVEKVLDVVAVSLIMVGIALVVPLPEWAVRAAQAAALLVLASVAGLGSLLVMERMLISLLTRAERAAPVLARLHLGAFIESFNQGLAFLRSPSALGRVALWTVGTWLVAAVTVWAALAGTGIITSPGAVGLVMALTNLGMVVPSGPGYVGYYHWLVQSALGAFSVDPSQALGTALVLHGVTFGTVLVGGLIYLWRGQYGLGTLLQRSQQSALRHRSGQPSPVGRQPQVPR